ncbi:ABC transporter permease [Saccharothrix variisporea]|uniref:ABC-2 type transport system permease protein n=1 Tax=Saccharothrix variisporea TaxID=543527 RepID=A0A495XNP4_9PSEU|nr:ABC transporter permease [Saccharothrix variisporea]RKT74083.1 ABC-2 type transport system permease protein [Saccharothrix variisporea]
MNARFLALELRRAVRNGRYLIFTVAVPALMFVLFVNLYGGQAGTFPNGVPVVTSLMMNMALFGVIAGPLSTGAGIAVERGTGWQRQLQLTPLSSTGYVLTKGVLGMVVALPAILLVSLVGVVVEGVRLEPLQWVAVLGTLWLAALPFVLVGIVVGLFATPDGMQAVTGVASMLFGLLGGIWIPADVAPDWLRTIMQVLPVYWAKELALASVASGVDVGRAVLVVGAWVLGLGLLAARRFRAAHV